jgi:O-antigen ligase
VRSAALEARDRFEPVLIYAATPGRDAARWTILVLLAAAPLAIGSAYPAAYVPLLVAALAVGLYSLYRLDRLRQSGATFPAAPGERLLVALAALVTLQLVPLPPLLLSWISPGSFAFYNDRLLEPLREWRPITASPADTTRGLLFLVAMGLLYLAAYRELDQPLWRRRTARTVVGVGFVMTIEALVQQAISSNHIYGLWRPTWDWAVFGPYVNRNLFAGYMLMALSVGLGLTAESLGGLRRAWSRRRRRAWLALGDPEGTAFFRWTAVSMVLMVGLLATRSRGAILGLVVSALAILLVSRHRLRTILALVVVGGLGVAWFGVESHIQVFASRGLQDLPRVAIWADSARLVPSHPLFGAGFNAFGTAYLPWQRIFVYEWVGTTHSEYLQAAVDLGLVGFGIVAALCAILIVRGARSAAQGAFHVGLFGAIAAVLAHNMVDINWQLPANAATFTVLAGLLVQPPEPASSRRRGPALERPVPSVVP